MKKEKEVFFVDVSGAGELRKELLECSKGVVEVLTNYERFKSANAEKRKEIENLKSKIRQISRLMSKLRSSLPTAKLSVIKPRQIINIKAKEKTSVEKEIKEPVKKAKTDLEMLEEELNEIEAKINSISK